MSICKGHSNDSFQRPISNSIWSRPATTYGRGRGGPGGPGRPGGELPSVHFCPKIISKRMTAPAKPKQMFPFGLESKFLQGRHRLLKLKNIRKRPELRFWFTRWTLKRGLIEI